MMVIIKRYFKIKAKVLPCLMADATSECFGREAMLHKKVAQNSDNKLWPWK